MHDQNEEYLAFGRDELAPLEMLAAIFEAREWSFQCKSDEEISAEYKGSWTKYRIQAVCREDDDALQVIVLPDITVPDAKRKDIYEALCLINEQLWIGHFDMWSLNGVLLFRHGALLPANGMITIDQAQSIVDFALDECERFYPVFQFIIWGDKTPEEAMAAALIDTAGEA
jgi:hypothetical protein